MYTQASDLLQAAAPLSTHPYWVAVSLLSFAVSGFIALSAAGKPACNVPYVKSWYYFGPPNWTLSTYRFIVTCVKDHGGLFTFRFRNMDVVFVSGQRWRNAVFSDRRLDLMQGMKLISVQTKQLIHPDGGEKATTSWMARELSRSAHMQDILPELLKDINRHGRTLGTEGKINLFDNNQVMIFRLILRYFGPVELTDDDDVIKKVLGDLNNVEVGSSLSATLLPGVPTPKRIYRFLNMLLLYRRLSKIIDKRRSDGGGCHDGLQLTLDNGYSNKNAIVTILSAYVVSMLNTGVIMSWTIVYLFANPQYLERVMAEIEDFTSEDTSLLASDQPINPPPTLLADLENPDTFPMLDACILEALRIRSSSIGVFRRNVSREAIVIDGVSVPTGAFVMYPLGDAHMASGAWGETNVFTFYPERFIGRDENAKIGDEKSQGDYLGFGAGAHVCTGRRLARLLIKMSTIYLLSNYDIQVVDNHDSPIPKEPLSDPLFLKLSLPNKGQEVHLKYKKRKTSASL